MSAFHTKKAACIIRIALNPFRFTPRIKSLLVPSVVKDIIHQSKGSSLKSFVSYSVIKEKRKWLPLIFECH